MNWITKPFRKPTAKEIAARELEDARRHLLAEHARAEYSAKIVEYHNAAIKRLSAYVGNVG